MLINLFEWLNKLGMPGASIIEYVTVRASMAFILALMVTMLIGGPIVRYLRKKKIDDCPREIGINDESEAARKRMTPTMGGVIIFAAIIIPCLLVCKLSNVYIRLLLTTTCILTALGFADDYIKVFRHNKDGLSGKCKIVVQVILGLIVGGTLYFSSESIVRENTEIYTHETAIVHHSVDAVKSTKTTIPFVKDHNFDYSWIASPLPKDWHDTASWVIFVIATIFIITGTSNGSNLTDGLDGLCTGICAIIGVSLMILAYVSSHIVYASYLNIMFVPGAEEVFIFASAFTGACMGFLWYNGYPAKVFMGDTGSLVLGGVIAVIAIVLRKEIMLIILCGIFLIEAVSVMMQTGYYKLSRKVTGTPKRIIRRAPLHHHFQQAPGQTDSILNSPNEKLHEQTIVLRFWLISILLCAFGILTLKIR